MAFGQPVDEDSYRIGRQPFGKAAGHVQYDSGMREILGSTNRDLTVNFSMYIDGSSMCVLAGYQVQPNLARGPAKGGICYRSRVPLAECAPRR
jgi:glutamate dehydrogenase (NAD(P)+)